MCSTKNNACAILCQIMSKWQFLFYSCGISSVCVDALVDKKVEGGRRKDAVANWIFSISGSNFSYCLNSFDIQGK